MKNNIESYKNLKNKNLLNAKIKKNDEFYTFYEDIKKELENYKEFFEDKIIYCPCDCFYENYENLSCSNFFKYFQENFFSLKLRKLICSFYTEDGQAQVIEMYPSDKNNKKIISICSSVNWTDDFENKSCIQLIRESDVVVTNPPFSKFINLFNLCVKNNKKFLLIGNKNVIMYKDIFPLFMENKVWFGINNVTSFFTPIIENKEKDKENKEKKENKKEKTQKRYEIQKFGNIGWITNLDNKRKNKKIALTKEYSKENYPSFLNFNAINIDKIQNIPKDYDGIMAVPLSFIDKYNPEQFEIIGAGINIFNEALNIGKIGEDVLKKYKEQGGKAHYSENMHALVYEKDGKIHFPYKRILIRKVM